MKKTYICIDLKSFYASVECVERGLDPLNTNLVVADKERTNKTICLAVTPSLKSFGIKGRPRLFEVEQEVDLLNSKRRKSNNYRAFIDKSIYLSEIKKNTYLKIDYLIATPRMSLYLDYSSRIYSIYLKYVSKDDIHVYSIDEVFMDVTNYLKMYKMTSYELAKKIISDIYNETKITATAGIGTNMFLAKVAMDILAKKINPDDGFTIAYLDETLYKKEMWSHEPLTDFWRIGNGYYKKLLDIGIKTMGDIARMSLYNEDKLYEMFGVNAELLIDHAWGYEPCTIKDIKQYKPANHQISSGQVIHCAYSYENALLIVKEMADQLSLDLVKKGLYTNNITLTIGYDYSSNNFQDIETKQNHYGKTEPKPAHSSISLNGYTQSTKLIVEGVTNLYKKIVDTRLLIKRVNVSFNTLTIDEINSLLPKYEQTSLFFDNDIIKIKENNKEKKLQNTVNNLKDKFGKNSVIKGMNIEKSSTMKERNNQIGGHKA